MRHDHPRGQPHSNGYHWCKACIANGISTADEALYQPRSSGAVIPGSTVSWSQYMGQDGKGDDRWVTMIGQVWSLTSTTWTREWYVVTADQQVWKVRQDSMKIISKDRADVDLV